MEQRNTPAGRVVHIATRAARRLTERELDDAIRSQRDDADSAATGTPPLPTLPRCCGNCNAGRRACPHVALCIDTGADYHEVKLRVLIYLAAACVVVALCALPFVAGWPVLP